MKASTIALGFALLAGMARPSAALQLNLATLSCAGYHQAILNSRAPVPHPDSINMVMWLLGYSVARAGAHVLYSDALASFGFALDAQCLDNPQSSLLDAIMRVRPRNNLPLELDTLNCREFQARHAELEKSDRESADTIMNWLQGFATAKAGSTVLDTATLGAFEDALRRTCDGNWHQSLYESLKAVSAAR